MTRLTLEYELRTGLYGPDVSAALDAPDTVAALDAIRHDPAMSPDARRDAADLLTDHLWPDESTTQSSNWFADYERNIREIEALKRMGRYRKPTGEDGEVLDGYHSGGVHFPEVPRAKPVTCPQCGFGGEFWNFSEVDAGTADAPVLRCPCGWEPGDTSTA